MRYQPVGKCIYCGAVRYDADQKRLAEEHIIPLAAGGDLILPQASCRKCEKLTCQAENSVLGMAAKLFRIRHKYKSRTKPPKKRPLHNVNNTGTTVFVPIEYYPNTFAMFLWPRPWLLSGKNHNDSGMSKLWYDMDQKKEETERLSALGIYSWRGVEIKNEMIFRMFAKIGHSYLSAEIGADNFKPMLSKYIRSIQENDCNIERFIGGTECEESQTENPYEIGWSKVRITGTQYALVSARLFAKQMGPTFLIITGEL